MTENNLPVKSTGNEIERYNVGLTKYTNSLIFNLNKEELFKEAINCFKQENYHEAYLKFYRIYQFHPVSKGLYPYLAYCAYSTDRKEKVEFFLWKDFEFKVLDAYYMNREILNEKQWNILIEELQFLESTETLLLRTHLYLIIRDFDGVEKIWSRINVNALFPNDFWYYYFRGILSFNCRTPLKYYEAIGHFSKAIELDPSNSVAYFWRGASKKAHSDYWGSIEDYSKCIELDPLNSYAYSSCANLKHRMENYSGALEDYSKYIELDKNNQFIYYYRALTRKFLKDYLGAISDFTIALEINIINTKTFLNIDLDKIKDLYGFSANFEISEEYLTLEKSIYEVRATTKQLLKDYLGALEDYNTAIELDPDDAHTYYSRGIAKYELKKYTTAIEDFSKAIMLNPLNLKSYCYRGIAYYELAAFPSAIKDFTKVISLDPNGAFAYSLRGDAKYKVNDYSGAIDDYTKSLELDSSDIDVYEYRSTAYEKMGDTINAKKDLEIYEQLRKK